MFGIVNGAGHYFADAFFDSIFLRSVLIAVVSGVIAGIFGLAIAKVQSDASDRINERIDKLETAQQAKNRRTRKGDHEHSD